jgi:hypothetical protein
VASFEYEGRGYELLVDIDDWLMAESTYVRKTCDLKGLADIGEALKNLDPEVLTAIAVISIKRGGGTATYAAVSESLRIGPLMTAVVEFIESGVDPESPDPTPAVDATA